MEVLRAQNHMLLFALDSDLGSWMETLDISNFMSCKTRTVAFACNILERSWLEMLGTYHRRTQMLSLLQTPRPVGRQPPPWLGQIRAADLRALAHNRTTSWQGSLTTTAKVGGVACMTAYLYCP